MTLGVSADFSSSTSVTLLLDSLEASLVAFCHQSVPTTSSTRSPTL